MRALVLSLEPPEKCPRAYRVIRLLSDAGYSVDFLGYEQPKGLEVKDVFTFERPNRRFPNLLLRATRLILTSFLIRLIGDRAGIGRWEIEKRFQICIKGATKIKEHYDVLVVEHWALVPFALRNRGAGIVVCDAREYYTREFESNLVFNLFKRPSRRLVCRHYLPKCSLVLTVSSGLAVEFRREFGISTEVIRSVSYFKKLPVSPVEKIRIRMVHHGVANSDRNLESMIEIAGSLGPDYSLDMYLTGRAGLIARLRDQANRFRNIRIVDPVPFEEIVSTLNRYDVGLYYLYPTGFNVEYCLPNKLFEFIQARLAVVIGPSPCMAEIVRQHECGFVAPEFSIAAMVAMIQSLNPDDIKRAKQKSDEAAQQLCFENEGKKLLGLLEEMRESKVIGSSV